MMRTLLVLTIAALPAFAQQTAPAAPQLTLPRPSPSAMLKQTVGSTDITITYSRPGVKGRQIFGALVPYGQVWRTGANEATTIAFSDDVTIDGKPLAAGTYSLHTIPGKNEWTLAFNKVAKQWGSFNYDAAQDALRVNAKAEASPFTEWLTFDVPKMTTDTATVVIRWEKVAVPFVIGTNTTQKALAAIHAALAANPNDQHTLSRAASFAVDNGIALDEASKWVDQIVSANESTVNLFLKARLQARRGDRAAAIATAERAIAKAGPKDAEEVNEIRKTMATWRQ